MSMGSVNSFITIITTTANFLIAVVQITPRSYRSFKQSYRFLNASGSNCILSGCIDPHFRDLGTSWK
jgi:hypothetical protein